MEFDIRSKLILLCAANISVFLFNDLEMEIACIAFIFLIQFVTGRKNTAWKTVLIYCLLVLIQLYVLPVLHPVIKAVLSVPVVQFRKMFPLLMVAVLIIRTTKVSEIIATMEKMHVSKSITVSLAVTIRYFPTMFEEWVHIKEAMSIRKIPTFQLNPAHFVKRMVQFYLVPLLISASKTIDELTAAAVTRGIDNPGKRSCWKYHNMGAQDYLLMITSMSLILFAITKRVNLL